MSKKLTITVGDEQAYAEQARMEAADPELRREIEEWLEFDDDILPPIEEEDFPAEWYETAGLKKPRGAARCIGHVSIPPKEPRSGKRGRS